MSSNTWLKSENVRIGTVRTILAVLIGLIFSAPVSAKEDVELIGGQFDFGYVPFGKTIKHRAILVNQSNTVVNITRVVPGCGCTQIPLKKKELVPGESLEVEILLETDKIRQGTFQKAPVFYTDSRETPRLTVTLTGFNLKSDDPQPPIKVTPALVQLQKGQNNSAGKIDIVNNTGRNIMPRIAEGGKPHFLEIELPYRQIVPGKMESINVRLMAGLVGVDRLDESITVIFNDQKQSRFTIPISITR